MDVFCGSSLVFLDVGFAFCTIQWKHTTEMGQQRVHLLLFRYSQPYSAWSKVWVLNVLPETAGRVHVSAQLRLCLCVCVHASKFVRVWESASVSRSLYKKKTEYSGRGCPVHALVEDWRVEWGYGGWVEFSSFIKLDLGMQWENDKEDSRYKVQMEVQWKKNINCSGVLCVCVFHFRSFYSASCSIKLEDVLYSIKGMLQTNTLVQDIPLVTKPKMTMKDLNTVYATTSDSNIYSSFLEVRNLKAICVMLIQISTE